MSALSPHRRRRLALGSLVFGGFAAGCSQFATVGLLPQIAQDLLGPAYAANPAGGTGEAGRLVGGYAAGAVLGAVFAVFGMRWSLVRVLQGALLLLAAGTIVSALSPDLGSLVLARFVTGVPHGAFLALAALAAARLVEAAGPEEVDIEVLGRHVARPALDGSVSVGPVSEPSQAAGRLRRLVGPLGAGAILVLGGSALANLVGVPLLTWLGLFAGWRTAFVVLAVLPVIASIGLLLTGTALREAAPRREPGDRVGGRPGRFAPTPAALRTPRAWAVAGLVAVGFGGFFAAYSYLAELATRSAGLPPAAVPAVFLVVGLGMGAGALVGGRAVERGLPRALLLGFLGLLTGLFCFGTWSDSAFGVFATAALLGLVAFALVPALHRLIARVTGGPGLLAVVLTHAGLNVGACVGALLGGTLLGWGLGYQAPAWMGLFLVLGGFVLAVVVLWVDGDRLEAASRDEAEGPTTTPALAS